MAQQTFAEWLARVPAVERSDPIWHVEAYRLARFAAWRVWPTTGELRKSPAGFRTDDQLHRAAWSIPANLAEGYCKSSVADRLRYYEIALGSTRECTVWCSAALQITDSTPYEELAELLSSVRRLLLTMIRSERRRTSRRVVLGSPG